MSSRLLAVAILALYATPGYGQETHTGRIEPNFINLYALAPGAPGQLLATMSWDSVPARLVLVLVCTIDGEEIAYGVASGMLDRFARLEAGVLPYPCEIGVITATTGANYILNLQLSQPQPATPQPPTAVPMRMSTRTIVIPGMSRGSAIERLAFRLQHALDRWAFRP
jgi:hypothetical protein